MPRKTIHESTHHQNLSKPLHSKEASQSDINYACSWYSVLGYSERDLEEDFAYIPRQGTEFVASLAVFENNQPHIPDMLKYIVDASIEHEEAASSNFRHWFAELPNLAGAVWEKDGLSHFYSNVGGEPTPVPNFTGLPKEREKHHGRTMRDASDLTANLLALHNYIYANEGSSSYEAFEEILKLLFVKMEDERQNSDRISRKFFIDKNEFASAMANTKKSESNRFSQRIDGLFEKAKSDYPTVFRDGDALNLRLPTLAFAISMLQELDLTHSPSDTKGAAFQKIVSASHRGERGQFITPFPVVQLIVNFLRPKPGEIVLDPACGTGSFLIEALRYMNRSNLETSANALPGENLYGIEINQALARVAMMQMILFGGNPAHILCMDALQDKWSQAYGEAVAADVILTNPPFGSQGRVSLRSLLAAYELGHKWMNKGGRWQRTSSLLTGQVPDILFIEKCLQMLRDGGRMGIVLPNGDLENPSLGYVRQFIRENADVLAVINLPQETFVPFGTGVKASVLFLQKHSRDRLGKQEKVFFGIIKNIGYEGGKHSAPKYRTDASGNVLKDKRGQPILDEDITGTIDAYETFLRTGTIVTQENVFSCSTGELRSRLDPNYYLPEYAELITHLQSRGAVPLKSIVRIVTQKSLALRRPENRIRYIELSDVDPRYPVIVNVTEMAAFEAPSRAAYDIHEGDIITAVSGNSTGMLGHATAYVTKEYDGCICSNGFRVVRATHIDPFYLLCYMKTPYFLRQVFRFRTGAAIPAINDNDLADILVMLPTQNVQSRIANDVKHSFELRSRALDVVEKALLDIG